MGRKITYDYVKNYIESFECELISTKYKKVDDNLLIKCTCGNIFKRSFKTFKKSKYQLCKTCLHKIITSKTRVSFDYVKKNIENAGEKLISEKQDYKNVHTANLRVLCKKCKNEYTTSFNRFRTRKKNQCPNCSTLDNIKQKRLSYDYIKMFISLTGCVLLTPEKKYVAAKHTLLKIQCRKCGENFYQKWDSFGGSHSYGKYQCQICSGKKHHQDYDFWKSFEIYTKHVRSLTEQNIRGKDEFKDRSIKKWHVDHKYSIYNGWLDNIDPKIISSIWNLELITANDNYSKGINNSITKKQLLSLYYNGN